MAGSQASGGSAARPLSPHLQIYKLTITMAMSIMHRITGAALYFGTLLLIWWLVAAASGPDAYRLVNEILGSFIGRLVLFGYTWAILHHMLGGIRHFIWDTGSMLDKQTASMLGWATLGGSLVLTFLIWIVGYVSLV